MAEAEILNFDGQTGPILLTGDLGREVYHEYTTHVDNRFEKKGQLYHKFGNGFERYDLMIKEDGTLRGCGSFSMALLDETLGKFDLRLVDLYDFQSLAQMDPGEALRGMHLNFGLVLVANKRFDFQREEKYNKGTKKLKSELKKQLLENGYPVDNPVYIPFSSLELALDEESPFGLQLKVIDTSNLETSAKLAGEASRRVLANSIIHVGKVEKQGVYDFKFYFNVMCLEPKNIDEMLKTHHSMGPERFDKMSHGYGRILAVPIDYRREIFPLEDKLMLAR